MKRITASLLFMAVILAAVLFFEHVVGTLDLDTFLDVQASGDSYNIQVMLDVCRIGVDCHS